MKVENLTQCICDICGKSQFIGKNDINPLNTYRLPMKYYTETGKCQGLSNQAIDLCADCAAELERNLSEHYDMCCIAYEGVHIERV